MIRAGGTTTPRKSQVGRTTALVTPFDWLTFEIVTSATTLFAAANQQQSNKTL
jgi:hypothetical protein